MSVSSFALLPDEEMSAASNLKAFMDAEDLANYETLLQRSESDPAWFWNAAIEFLDIRFYQPYSQVIDLSAGVPDDPGDLSSLVNPDCVAALERAFGRRGI